MSKNPRRHLEANPKGSGASSQSATPIADNTPSEITKQEFGRRLYNKILERGWNQSELARRASIGRDAVSTYVRGRSFPEPVTLKKICSALDVEPSELLPNITKSAIEKDAPAFSLNQSPGDPSRMWMKVNQAVTPSQATRIMAILNEGLDQD